MVSGELILKIARPLRGVGIQRGSDRTFQAFCLVGFFCFALRKLFMNECFAQSITRLEKFCCRDIHHIL